MTKQISIKRKRREEEMKNYHRHDLSDKAWVKIGNKLECREALKKGNLKFINTNIELKIFFFI